MPESNPGHGLSQRKVFEAHGALKLSMVGVRLWGVSGRKLQVVHRGRSIMDRARADDDYADTGPEKRRHCMEIRCRTAVAASPSPPLSRQVPPVQVIQEVDFANGIRGARLKIRHVAVRHPAAGDEHPATTSTAYACHPSTGMHRPVNPKG